MLPFLLAFAIAAAAQAGVAVSGRVLDATGAALPGVPVTLTCGGASRERVSDESGGYLFLDVAPGACELSARLINFTEFHRQLDVGVRPVKEDVVLQLALSADVTVTAPRSFRDLAEVDHPEESLVGLADAASSGAVTPRQIESRPLMRTGELLETIPGLIASQHSGEGKANQYYLRGFNLDHGTDFATFVAGMPVNMPTHAHGQGYTDVNFVIPELVSGIQYRKGPYWAEFGDFSAAGAATINYVSALDKPIVKIDGGQERYFRGLLAGSPSIAGGHLLYALDVGHDDGPWTIPEDLRKVNAVLRFTRGDARRGVALTGMAYRARWRSSDQIPARAVAADEISRYGAIDGTDGGDTHRYSGSVDGQWGTASQSVKATGYVIGYGLDLFSDFTYYLDDPLNGDQFEQQDERVVSGGRVTHRALLRWGGADVETAAGIEVRHDAIGTIGLYHTVDRVRLDTRSLDRVGETSGAVFGQAQIQWGAWLRIIAGLRGDTYRFDVTATDSANSGRRQESLASPKAAVVLGPWGATEFYVNAGEGFHSNDARGVTITEDPVSHDPVSGVTPLVRARGAEVGVRTVAIPHVQTTVTLWTLGLASELVFSGDAGTTDASRPSRRTGVEWATFVSPREWLLFDADVAWSRARFTGGDPAGPFIPGSAGLVASLGATFKKSGWSAGLRWREFGPRPLIEDDSVRSRGTSLVNLLAARRLTPHLKATLDAFNLANVRDSDIDYYYASRLPGEPADGVDDIHFHPVLPRTVRLGLAVSF